MRGDPTTKSIFTTGDVAQLCEVAPRTVAKWIDGNVLTGFRLPLSEDRRVTREELVRFLTVRKLDYAIRKITPEAKHEGQD